MWMRPGVRFHAMDSYQDARRKTVPGNDDVSVRNAELKELYLARALYRCGDKAQLGQNILQRYANGFQGHYAHYAEAALKA